MSAGWVAYLSDGQLAVEGEGQPGELTPWQQFRHFIMSGQKFKKEVYNKETGLTSTIDADLFITRMELNYAGRTIYTPGHKSVDGFYLAYESKKSIFTDRSSLSRGIGFVKDDLVFVTWVDENGQIYQDIRDLEVSQNHIIMRYIHDDPDDKRTTGNPDS